MDTNRIRYFLSLVRTGSITKAAEFHHISPAAFSKAMKVFETEVGESLTLAHGRGIMLTDYAKSISLPLQEIIRQIDSIRDRTTVRASAKDVLRIATFEVFSTYFMARAVSGGFADYRCEIYEMIPGQMEDAIARGKADLALTYIPIPHPDLDFLPVQEIEMGVFGHRKWHAEANFKALPFAIPLSPVEGSPNKVRGLDGWPEGAFPRSIKFQVDLMETAIGLCREGLAVIYIPKFVAKLYNEVAKSNNQLDLIPLPRNFSKKRDAVFLIKRKSDKEGKEAKKLAQAVRKICR